MKVLNNFKCATVLKLVELPFFKPIILVNFPIPLYQCHTIHTPMPKTKKMSFTHTVSL